MMAKILLVITLLAVAQALASCATAEETEMQVEATVAAELTRLAATVAPEPTATPLPTATPTLAELVARYRLSIAQIITPDGTGTGFVYDPAGLVATNAHVVESRRQVVVVLNGVEYKGQVLNRDEDADLAVVKVNIENALQVVSLGSAGRVALGEDVMALGFPLSSQLGDDLTVTRGIVSARREFEGYEYFQTDAALNPGNSGGPLLDGNGDVIGIVTFGIAQAEGVAFALSVEELISRLGTLSRVPPTATPIPTLMPTEQFKQVSAATTHTCGVKGDGQVVCWGDDTHGEAIPPAGTFQQVSTRQSHTCGVKIDGRVTCWGFNKDGQATPPAGTFRLISVGEFHTCGVKIDGQVACWGIDEYGESNPPSGTFRDVSPGFLHTCGVRTDGRIVCWGYEADDGRATPPTGTFRQVSAGRSHTCGVKTDGQVVCWGDSRDERSTPPVGTFQQVSAGFLHTCGVKTDGQVVCWGANTGYDGGYAGQATPPDGTFQQVSAGFEHTCGVRIDGEVVCWGDNRRGRATPP